MGFRIANGFGSSLKVPTADPMRAFLDELDIPDEEHGAAWPTPTPTFGTW